MQLKTNFESVTLKDVAPKQYKFLTNFFFRLVTKLMKINMHILDKNPLEDDAAAKMKKEQEGGSFVISNDKKKGKKGKGGLKESDLENLDEQGQPIEGADADGALSRSVSPHASPRHKAKHI